MRIPLFERLIYYLLIPELFCRIALEFGAGIYWYTLNQPKQWCIYLIIFCEYIYQIYFVRTTRFHLSWNIAAGALLLVMLLHGVISGLYWGNAPSKIATDSIPLTVMVANIAFLSREGAFDGFSFKRLTTAIYGYAATMLAVGFLAVSMGKPSIISVGTSAGSMICLSVIAINFKVKARLNIVDIGMVILILAAIAPSMNRTSLVVLAFSIAFFILPRVIKSVVSTYLFFLLFISAIVLAPVIVPEDSPLMRRLETTLEFDSAQTNGSLGERQSEVLAINERLEALGPDGQMFGLGAGGTYFVVFSRGHVPENYSHAHYGWALFKLRYGYVGYFYLTLFLLLLSIQTVRGLRRKDPADILIGMMAAWGIIYTFTYVSHNMLTVGLQFTNSTQRSQSPRFPIAPTRMPAPRWGAKVSQTKSQA